MGGGGGGGGCLYLHSLNYSFPSACYYSGSGSFFFFVPTACDYYYNLLQTKAVDRVYNTYVTLLYGRVPKTLHYTIVFQP